jgi:hypothetical protein
MSTFATPQPSVQSNTAPRSAATDLEAAHNAAWDRFNAAEAAHKADPTSLPAMREYSEACKQLQRVQDQYSVNGLRGM